MSRADTKILFMGTPEFAAIQLKALCDSGFALCGAVTQTDKPVGRHKVLTPPPVKQLALSLGLPVYQPKTLRNDEFAALLDSIAPDIIVVAAYGKILPPNVIAYPKFGCINVHGSYLPRWRGAAPIQRAIMAGDRATGATVMRMDDGIDTGDVIVSGEIEITGVDNYGTLHDKIAALGAKLLIPALDSVIDGSAVYTKQGEAGMTYAAKIENGDCALDFTRSAAALCDQIRALYPEPLAYCVLRGNKIKILHAVPAEVDKTGVCRCGEVYDTNGGMIAVACGGGSLCIDRLLPAGKAAMSASDFIRGRNVIVGDIFGV